MEKLSYTITFSVFYILGVISFYMGLVIPCALILLVVVIIALFKNIFSNKSAIIFYLAFVLAFVNCNIQTKDFDDLSPFVSQNGVISGYVESIPTTGNAGKTKFYLKADTAQFGNKKEHINARTIVTLTGKSQNFKNVKIADYIEIKGRLCNPVSATNPSQFDYRKYLRYHKTFSTFYSDVNAWKVVAHPKSFSGKFLQKLSEKRSDIIEIHSNYMKSPNLEVLGGIVFGDDAINPPEEIRNSFINSGLLHILAASGMNVSIIFGLWFFVGTRLRLNYKFVILTGAVLVAFYTLMTGMGPSVLRAALMIEFVLFGKLINRSADSIALVFFVAFLMLLYNPAMINDVGFQLSFVVTFALMFYCPPVLENFENKIAEFVVGGMMIPLVAQLFAAPIQMFYFNSFATYSVLANFAITPFITVLSFLGFVGSIFAMIPFLAYKSCMIFDWVLNPVVTILVKISNYFSNLPHSLLTTSHPSHLQIVSYYALLLSFGFALRNKFVNKKIICLFISFCLLFGLSFIKANNRNCEILIFDVGNADSFLIKSPDNKYIMIDTAKGRIENSAYNFSQAEAVMGKYLKDNGIKELELLIITHFDSDHSGGAVDLMKWFNVKKVVISKEDGENNGGSLTTKNILKHLRENKINYEYARNNEEVFNSYGVKLKTYVPGFTENRNDNDNSTITLLSYGDFDMLFMADGGVRSFNKIQKDLKNNKIEIVKTGHHGAADTVSDKMLEVINPDSAIISTGKNIYGHPNDDTLNILYEHGVDIFRTDINKAIKISTNSQKYTVNFYDSDKDRFYKVCEKYLNFAK